MRRQVPWYPNIRLLSARIGGKDEHAIILCQRCLRIADKQVAIQAGRQGGMQPIQLDEFTERRNPARQSLQNLAQRLGLYFQFRDASALTRDTEEFYSHGSRRKLNPW